MSLPKFSSGPQSFHAELKKRIANYFEEVGKAKTGNYNLFLKAVILMVSFVFIYVHLVFFTPNAFWCIVESVLLGGVVAAIGFNVMHDGAHGSFSKYRWVNGLAAFSLNILGGNSFMWNMKHNVVHHSYTNVEGIDDDIDIQPWMRMTRKPKTLSTPSLSASLLLVLLQHPVYLLDLFAGLPEIFQTARSARCRSRK